MGHAMRLIVWIVGLALVIAAAWVLWTMTAVSELVPWGVFVAVVLVILGVGIMGAANQIRGERERVVERA
jgi:hypothetical protein